MFLFTLFSRMIIWHKFDITHLNVDDLSRLTFNLKNENEFDVFNEKRKIELSFIRKTMSITIIKNINDFLKRVVKKLMINDIFKKIYAHLQKQIQKIDVNNKRLNTFYQFYKLDLDFKLLNLVSRSESNKLCILKALQKEILEYAYDKHAHEEVHRTYNFLRHSVFISKMKKLINEYVISYLIY